jgi:hypothetical protein
MLFIAMRVTKQLTLVLLKSRGVMHDLQVGLDSAQVAVVIAHTFTFVLSAVSDDTDGADGHARASRVLSPVLFYGASPPTGSYLLLEAICSMQQQQQGDGRPKKFLRKKFIPL